MELHVHFLPGRVNSPGFETLSYQLVANAHILRLCLIIADTLSWGVQRQSNQYIRIGDTNATLDQRMTSDGCRTGHIPRICTNHDITPPLEASSSTSSTPRIGGTLRNSMPMPGTSSAL